MCNSDNRLKDTIDTNAELSSKMTSLIETLMANLKDEFGKDFGIAFPSATDCEVYSDDATLQYSHTSDVGPFIKAAGDLVEDLAVENYGAAAKQATTVATIVANEILGSSSLSVGVKGSAKRCSVKDTDGTLRHFFSACYASTSQCKASEWFQTSDFFVAKTALLVLELKDANTTMSGFSLKPTPEKAKTLDT